MLIRAAALLFAAFTTASAGLLYKNSRTAHLPVHAEKTQTNISFDTVDRRPPGSVIDSLIAAASYAAAESAAVETLQEMQLKYGTEDARLVPLLLEAGIVRYELGRYTEAEELFQRALKIESNRGIKGRPRVLTALRYLALVQTAIGELPAAEKSAKRCIELSRELHGEENAHCAGDLSITAKIRITQDRLGEAADLLDTAISLIEEQWGPGHEDLAELLLDRGKILNSLGRHNEALPLFKRSLSIKTGRWGPDHPETTGPLLGIASIHNKKGEFARAEALYGRCLDILEHASGPAHPLAAEAASDFSVCLANLDKYDEAEEILRRHLEATVASYGERNSRASDLMLNLAKMLAVLGRQVESTRLYRRAASIIEEVHGPNHTRSAAALSGLAHTKLRSGNYHEAEPLYRRSIQIIEQSHGSPHPDLIHYRCQLGMCLLHSRRYDEAHESIERGIAEASEIYGAESYQVALEERHLGLLLSRQGRTQEAYPVLKRSLATLEKYFGPDHNCLSKCLKGLAQASFGLDLFNEAHIYISRAVSLHERAAGRDQLELTHLLGIKTAVEINLQMWDAAVATSLRSAENALAEVEDIYQATSTNEALFYVSTCYGSIYGLINAAVANPDLSDSTLARIFSLVVRTQGHVLDWLAERQEFLDLSSDTCRVAQLRTDFADATQRLADLLIRGPGDNEETYSEELATARRNQENAERALSSATGRLRPADGPRRSGRRISADMLADALNPGATLIQFIRYYKRVEVISNRVVWVPNNRRYGAFRLKKNGASSWDLEFVDLGRDAPMDSLIFAYRRAIDEMEPGRRPTAREETEYRSIASQLYERIWEPLMPVTDEMDTIGTVSDSPAMVFLVPDSWLHVLDFNTLLAPTGELVIERWKLHRLSSGDDLLRPRRKHTHGTGLLTVGNPSYATHDFRQGSEENQAETRSSHTLCAEAYRRPEPLPGAERETRAVAELFSVATGEPVTVLLGPEATEGAVKRLLNGKRAAHFATHGFYCEESKKTDRATSERITDPLLMSGLVLASVPEENDGLLTAQEVIGLDLSVLDWVVLSACSSGLGRLIRGEGLFGLQRAFEIAGAGTVVMTLWRIDDTGMQELMEQIYRHRLGGSPTVDAIRQAQLERLRDKRRRLNRIHPILWAGIIAQGDWR